MQDVLPGPVGSALVANYESVPAGFDELKDPAGAVRPHWATFLDKLGDLGTGELMRRWDTAQHLIHENGVTYNIYGDPQGLERPWRLSPLPVLIPPEDWGKLGAGLAQRGELLTALLEDLYGPQRTLTEGLIPPEIVFSHPNFLRPLHGVGVARQCWLPIYGADLVRAPSGEFRVLEDKTQAPSGSGYALENRIVISRVLPDLFRECNVERLALFFRTLRETLQSLAPHNRDNPRIVLLASGPSNATYFEQAYLAKYLDFTLVYGADLTVRDDRVFLKTLGGLQQVDVIVRRVNDDFCDPLELRSDSLLGVPGLVQALRSGNVAIANAIGSGLVQSPALLPYLPRLCRRLLDQEFVLPSVRTLWCGSSSSLQEVLADPDQWVIKPAFPGTLREPLFVSTLPSDEKQELVAMLKARPSSFVAQEFVALPSTPVLAGDKLVPRPYVLCSFAFADGRGQFVPMPGGLARVAERNDAGAVSMQLGAGSKDVWVLSTDRVTSFSLLPPANRALTISRGGSDLPSRVADNLYWLGRYAERADGVARLCRVIGTRLSELTDDADFERAREFEGLFAALREQTQPRPETATSKGQVRKLKQREAELFAAVVDPEVAGSLAAVVNATLRAGRTVRDRISMDTWRVLAGLDEQLGELASARARSELPAVVSLLNSVVVDLAAFTGLVMDSMSRGQAFRFLDVGRRIERAMSLVNLLRATTLRSGQRENTLLEAVLETADSSMTYRRRYLAALQGAPVVDLLLTDETNARSVMYQIGALADHLRALPLLPGTGPRSPQLRLALTILNELELADVESLCAVDQDGTRPALIALLDKLEGQLPALSDSLSDSYLNHATLSRHLTQGVVDPARQDRKWWLR
jgi:uncharacterized circularly permuted ATP-grasp superfamily protein/uncharacterized alpha-E superfamily protein